MSTVLYGTILSGKYTIEFIQPNRPSTMLILEVDAPGEGIVSKKYLVGFTDNWRPGPDMAHLEKVLVNENLRTQFTKLVWWWREYCGFDWREYTKETAKGKAYPCYPISELIGRSL